MSYKYSKGNQIIGDLSGSDDADRNTGIDFEEDYIGFEAGGSTIMVVSGSKVGIGTDSPISKLDVAGKIAITAEVSTPSAPADGKGWLYTKTAGGGGGSTDPAGSDTHIQYNNDGSFGGSSNLTFDDTNNILKTDNITFKDIAAISGDAASGEIVKFGSGTLTAGKLYYLHTDGAWTVCDADSSTAGNNQLLLQTDCWLEECLTWLHTFPDPFHPDNQFI